MYSAGRRGVFVDFYRSGFLHGLLPLADGYVWTRNALFVLALGWRDRVHTSLGCAEKAAAAGWSAWG